MVKQCGPQLALVIPDARAERTKPQVCCFQSLMELVKRKEKKRKVHTFWQEFSEGFQIGHHCMAILPLLSLPVYAAATMTRHLDWSHRL